MNPLDIFDSEGIESLRNIILKIFLQDCIPGYDVYFQEDIPYSLYLNARSNYAYGVDYDDVIALADVTVFSTGKRGLLFTKEGVYYKDLLSQTEYGEYGTLSVYDDMYSSSYYDKEQMKNLFKWLNNLEYMSYVYKGIKITEELLDLSEDEWEEMLEEIFVDVIVPAFEEKARLFGQDVAYDFLYFIKSLLFDD